MKLLQRLVLLPVLLSALAMPGLSQANVSAENQTSFTADYVVVGVGTAGGLMAKRLSDDKTTSVIALHIGENLTEDPLIKYSKNTIFTVGAAILAVPLNIDPNLIPPEFRAQFETYLAQFTEIAARLYVGGETIPQINADNRELLWVMALPLGGASSVNGEAWCKGTDQLYAQWAAIAGPEWSVERISRTYRELEDYHGKTNDPIFRGHHGPIDVRLVPASNLSRKFTRAIVNAVPTPFVLDYNDPLYPIGASSNMQLTQKCKHGNLRVSSSTAFLNSTVMKPNGHGVKGRKLRVLFNSFAQRVIWDGTRAAGVEFVQNGVTKTVMASKGVVVTAGIRSSTFLLQSGVGSAALLNSLNIPVVFDNPNVGQGLADQPAVRLVYATNPTDIPTPNTIFGNIAWLPAPGGDPTSRQIRLATVAPFPGIAILTVDLCQPASRGSITINSADPSAPFVMDLGVLSNPSDLQLFQSALSTYIPAVNAQLQSIDPQYRMIFPTDPAFLTDPILSTAFIQETVGSNMHFQSHCRMAPLDQGGVVDSTGHVYGVQNLIVADDSVVPQCMDGSPMASAYLIAANIARLLGYE